MLPGLGPDAPTTTNSKGGKQSHLPYRFDLLPAKATSVVASVLHYGAEKYGKDNWKNLSIEEILNHVLAHIFAYLEGDDSDKHLAHAATRMLMALELSRPEIE